MTLIYYKSDFAIWGTVVTRSVENRTSGASANVERETSEMEKY